MCAGYPTRVTLHDAREGWLEEVCRPVDVSPAAPPHHWPLTAPHNPEEKVGFVSFSIALEYKLSASAL